MKVHEAAIPLLERLKGAARLHAERMLAPYENEEANLRALRAAWLTRAMTMPDAPAMQERRALEELLGMRLHAKLPRGKGRKEKP